ncbi:Aminotransferase-like plant mobile domain [Arabidopsis suecica]|uniref:Aminotransferase-like plant mobile domain n=1 Tax=Arabidopsis suecica TaxID=45249 RepID=A0A8T2CKR3_ARASU|nr:Aminotransferase-like plant mobile domain [Arabidopsis suecica]
MASPTENSNRPNSKKDHLLKPCLTSINGSQAHLCQKRSAPSPDLEALSMSVNFWGWRYPQKKFNSWARKMAALHKPIWRKAGIFEAILASTYNIRKNTDLVLGIAEKWCPDTNTFVFSWGEATITLEDVMVLLGFSVLGSPVFDTLDSSGKKILAILEKEWLKIKKDKVSFVTQVAWMERFMDSGDELEHVAFLVLWLSYFVFPTRYYHIYEAILPIAIHLSSGTKMALAPAVLAHLYADLSLLKNHITAFSESPIKVEIDLSSLFKLVNVWIWERFRALQPKPNLLVKGEPRLARWHDLKQRTSNARWTLGNSNSFEWRPYTKTVKNWDFPQFYPEKAMWVTLVPNLDDECISFARCIKVSELVGIQNVEHYFPNRVASQFGMLQDAHCPVNRNNLSREAAWNDYSKPIGDLALYIPSRSAISSDTRMFCDQWRKGVVGSAKTLRTSIGDDSSCVLSASKMNRRSEDGRKIAEDSTKKRLKYMKGACKNDGSTMGRCQKQVPSDSDDDDDSLTVAQITTLYKKKCSENSGGNASEPLGKKIKLEADNNDLGPCQKLSSIRDDGDETVPPPEIEQKNEEPHETGSKAGLRMVLSPFDEKNSSKPPVDFGRAIDIVVSAPETSQFCDDELDVYGSNAEKKTMIDDDSEEPKCLLHEDGTMTREMVRSDKKCCSEAEKEDADGRINEKVLALKADNNKSSPHQELDSGCTNGDETSKVYKPKVLKPSDESNIHIAVGHGNERQDCLLHDDGIGSEEETMKFSEQLKVFEKRNNDLGEGDNDTTEKRFQKLKVLVLSIEERINKAERTAAWLNERRAIKQRKIAAAGLS